MKYTVSINEKSRSITVTLADGTKGVARCNPCDRFDINTGIELALERAKVASKAKTAPAKPTITEAIKVVEEYVGDHIAIVGRGASLSENQKRELRKYADMYAPSPSRGDRYNEGYAKGYDDGYADACDECECEDDYEECEPNCGCHDNGGCECRCDEANEVSAMVKRMIARIEEILGQ